MSSKHSSAGPHVAIIGAGVGGLSFAIALKRKLGYENFTIFEKESDVGGTWRDNIYPACASDVKTHFYSLSSDLNPNWSASFVPRPEFYAYWKNLTEKYSLAPHIVFNSKVISADWDTANQVYNIVTEDVRTGVQNTTAARILISALGVLEIPKIPDIPGLLNEFKGDFFHTARWRNDIDLRNKNVAAVGSGASTTQYLPIISEDPSVRVTNFVRTPSWLTVRPNSSYSAVTKWIFAHVPFVMRIHRNLLYLGTEMAWIAFGNAWAGNLTTKALTKYITSNAPKEYLDKLIPNYTLGCRRIIFDTGYLDALHRPNVALNADGISHVTKDSVVTSKGEAIKADVIILGTGFVTNQYPVSVRGTNGQSVEDYYQSKGGPQAYLGTTVPGFPNFHLLSGPNTLTGHTSVIFTTEIQVNYAIKLMKPVLSGKLSSLEVTHAATDAYNVKIQKWLSNSVWSACTSWYRTGGEGKISSNWPGPGFVFWWWLRKPIWADYIAVGDARGKKAWAWERRRHSVGRWSLRLSLAAALLLLWTGKLTGIEEIWRGSINRALPYIRDLPSLIRY